MTEKEKAIALILDKAKALMNEVELLLQNKYYTTAISRLYYSCFNATKALLLTKDLTTKTHSGVIALLYKHFVIENNFDKENAAFLSKLMQERIDADYGDFMVTDLKKIQHYIEPAKKYLEYIISYIKPQQ